MKGKKLYKKGALALMILTTVMLSMGGPLSSQSSSPERQSIILEDQTGGHAVGQATIRNNPHGPDQMAVYFRNLPANTRFTILLTNSPTLGALPVQFLGHFTSNDSGVGFIYVRTEVINAFASANQTLANELGIADVVAAGALANGANTIPLNWIRVYYADGNISVFGVDENTPGGGLFLTAKTPIK